MRPPSFRFGNSSKPPVILRSFGSIVLEALLLSAEGCTEVAEDVLASTGAEIGAVYVDGANSSISSISVFEESGPPSSSACSSEPSDLISLDKYERRQSLVR